MCIGNSKSWFDTISNRNGIILNLKKFDKQIKLNRSEILSVSSNVMLKEIYKFLNPLNLMLSNQPGYLDITVGGCISNNVHGKDSFKFGTFAENIIDTCIYKGERGIGLRMPFAYKVDKLENGKKFYVNRRYTVYGVVRSNGELDPTLTTNMRSNIHLTLKLCSIRSHHAPISYIKKRKHSDITIDANTIRKDQEILEYAGQIHESFRNTTIIETKNVDPKYGHHLEFVLDNHRYCPYMQKVHNQSCLYLTLNIEYGLLGAGCWCRKHDCIKKYKPNKVPLPQHLCRKYNVLHKNGLPKGFM